MVFRRSHRGWSVTLFVFLCIHFMCSVSGQSCSMNTDCHPASYNLIQGVGSTFPNRSISVSSTCGINITTIYYISSYARGQESPENFYCNATYPHQKEMMYDRQQKTEHLTVADLTTYWQSENTIAVQNGPVQEQYVALELMDKFLIRYIRIVFISPHITLKTDDSDMRPLAMVFEKKSNNSGPWIPLRYYAENCNKTFPGVPIQNDDGTGPSYTATTAVCKHMYYGRDKATFTNWGFGRQEVPFNPGTEYDPEFAHSYLVQKHYLAVAVRLRLVKPAETDPFTSFYAIADIEVDGQCACFGHAANCTGPNDAKCMCEHNTAGSNCEECLPLYNNKPWRIGSDNKANACESCGCNGQADSCYYDKVKGYGVCVGCRDHTTGDKCQYCDSHYYVNPHHWTNTTGTLAGLTCPGFNGTNTFTYNCSDYCIPCNCSQLGSLGQTDYNCDNYTGQCDCKVNVGGRKCDECLDGYWDLSTVNAMGCQACQCELKGTVNSTNYCDKQTGICVCKNNTMGIDCATCKPGTFNLTTENPDGCSPCDCDPGASLSRECPLVSGQCQCRSKIGGRRCTDPFTGFYVPRLDGVILEAEFTPNASLHEVIEQAGHGEPGSLLSGRGYVKMRPFTSLTFIVEPPKSFKYELIARYKSSIPWSGVRLDVKLQSSSAVPKVSECGGKNYTSGQPFSATQIMPAAPLEGSETFGQLCMFGGATYEITVNLPAVAIGIQDPYLLLDSMVLMPVLSDTQVYKNADQVGRITLATCNEAASHVSHLRRNTESCQDAEYAVMAELYQGALSCGCNITGSTSLVCSPRGGQCRCKTNVMLLDCSQCKVDHYDFSSGQGCLPCNCHDKGSAKTACNDIGICECKANVTGVKCNACISNHYGLHTGQGCRPCECNMRYALNNTCSDTGQCLCKPGVGGLNCDRCLDGFYNLTLAGCTPCECNQYGTAAEACDKTTGRCICKSKAVGDKCDQCPPAHYGLGPWKKDGCMPCICSGHSTNCTSATGWYSTKIQNNWSLLQGSTALQDPWTGVDGEGKPVLVEDETVVTNSGSQFVMRLTNTGAHTQRELLYFSASDKYLGDKQTMYGNTLSVMLAMFIPASYGQSDLHYINTTKGDVILQGKHACFSLAARLPSLPHVNVTTYTFPLQEEAWRVNSTEGRLATFEEMMETLMSLGAILVRGKFYNATGVRVDLYGAVMYVSSRNASSGQPVNNVEQCVCPFGYTGASCEQCAAGFTRRISNGGRFIECVPCQCNGHAFGPVACDPESGQCNCTHNTTGKQCQFCASGYFGAPLNGRPDACQECSCPGHVVQSDINVFATTCRLLPNGEHQCVNCSTGHAGLRCEICLPGFYGVPEDPMNNFGRCVPCECNNRADMCNSTSGMCQNCRNNTAGKECDICAPTYFGNAMTYDCQECNCTLPGATGDCDHRTGQCVCKPNVHGFRCDQCVANSYNYTSGLGCTLCDCHPTGSLGPSCNVTNGQCECKSHVAGRQCELCEDTYWNINALTGCDPCGCSGNGTEVQPGLTSGTCDLVTGQCTCAREAIIGRTCDYCAKGTLETYQYVTGVYVGEYPTCSLCGQCFDNWAEKIDKIAKVIYEQHATSIAIWKNYDNLTVEEVEPVLTQMQMNITGVQSSIVTAQQMVDKLQYLSQGFLQVDSMLTTLSDVATSMELKRLTVHSLYSTSLTFTGKIQVSPGELKSPAQIFNETDFQSTVLINLIARGNSSWVNIQNLTDIIRSSNGSSQGLLDQVDQAMNLLQEANSYRNLAEAALLRPFEEEFQNNSRRIDHLSTLLGQFKDTSTGVGNLIDDAVALTKQANQTAELANQQMVSKQTQMFNSYQSAQVTLYNTTNMRNSVGAAQSACNNYLSLGIDAKKNMTESFVIITYGLDETTRIDNHTKTAGGLMQQINSTDLRSLTDMQNLTARINNTLLSDMEVSRVLASASQGLHVAQESLNLTSRAAENSKEALDLVRTIQKNLQNAQIEQVEVDRLLGLAEDYNASITDSISLIQGKANLGFSTARRAEADRDSVNAYVSTVEACFLNQKDRAEAARNKSRAAQSQAAEAAQIHEQNKLNVTKASGSAASIQQASADSLTNLEATDQEVNQLTSDLAGIEQITNLQNLLDEYISLRIEVNAMSASTAAMEAEIDNMLRMIETLTPDSTACTHT